MFGVIGAFLAVPVAAAVAVIIRYYGEQVGLRAGENPPDDGDDGDGEGSEPVEDETVEESPTQA